MTEHVLVVGPGRDFPARIRRAMPGAETTVIVQLEYVGNVREPGGNTRVIGIRGDAPDQDWIDLAAAAHALQPFTRIAAFGERNQDRCAAIGQALGLSTHSPQTVALVHDKEAMRSRLREAGVDPTAHARVADLEELRAFVREHGMPCVVKPISGAGSAGVSKVAHEGELATAFDRAGGSYLGLPNTGVLVEQYHEGPQFSVEAFSENGEHQVVGITRKYSDPVTFVELGHVSPAELPARQRQEVQACVERMLNALDIESGPTHTEIILTAAGPRVIETHVRTGGDEIPSLTLDATGVDLDDCAVRQTLGEKVLPGIRATLAEVRTLPSSAIWFAGLETSGLLEEVAGADRARAVPGVSEVGLLVPLGSKIGVLTTSKSRVARARALGPTADKAVAAAQEAVARLEFRLSVRAAEGPTV